MTDIIPIIQKFIRMLKTETIFVVSTNNEENILNNGQCIMNELLISNNIQMFKNIEGIPEDDKQYGQLYNVAMVAYNNGIDISNNKWLLEFMNKFAPGQIYDNKDAKIFGTKYAPTKRGQFIIATSERINDAEKLIEYLNNNPNLGINVDNDMIYKTKYNGQDALVFVLGVADNDGFKNLNKFFKFENRIICDDNWFTGWLYGGFNWKLMEKEFKKYRVYIREDQIPEFQRRGFKIKRGSRGGIIAERVSDSNYSKKKAQRLSEIAQQTFGDRYVNEELKEFRNLFENVINALSNTKQPNEFADDYIGLRKELRKLLKEGIISNNEKKYIENSLLRMTKDIYGVMPNELVLKRLKQKIEQNKERLEQVKENGDIEQSEEQEDSIKNKETNFINELKSEISKNGFEDEELDKIWQEIINGNSEQISQFAEKIINPKNRRDLRKLGNFARALGIDFDVENGEIPYNNKYGKELVDRLELRWCNKTLKAIHNIGSNLVKEFFDKLANENISDKWLNEYKNEYKKYLNVISELYVFGEEKNYMDKERIAEILLRGKNALVINALYGENLKDKWAMFEDSGILANGIFVNKQIGKIGKHIEFYDLEQIEKK